jgi:hypothetical protein
LLDFWSRHPTKEPCPCWTVIPRVLPQGAGSGGRAAPPRSSRPMWESATRPSTPGVTGADRHRQETRPEPQRAVRPQRGHEAHPGAGKWSRHPQRAAKSVVGHRLTEHHTYDGKVYCAVVLDTFSRAGRRIIYRFESDRGPSHQRPRHGHRQPRPPSRRDCLLRPRGDFTSWAFTDRP